MPPVLYVALGSALGGVARWAMVAAVDARLGAGLPWGTLMVNVLGGLLIGVCGVWADRDPVRLGLMVGVLGGFTTFSAYSLQILRLIQDGRVAVAIAYALASVLLCLVACWLGWLLAARISGS
jgi:CrcB protein